MAFSQIVQDAAEETFGPGTRVNLRLREPHSLSTQPRVWVAWAGNYETAFALGVGETTDAAFRDLLRSVYAEDHTVPAETVGRILCVNGSRVRQFVKAGRLVPVSAVGGPIGARYDPTDVLRRAGLIREPPPKPSEQSDD